MRIQTNDPTVAAQHIMATELDVNIKRLEDATSIPANLRAKRMQLLQQLSEYKHSWLIMARDSLAIEEARLFMEIKEALDDKGKPKYGNDDARKHALVQLAAEDEAYKEAQAAYRAAEQEVERLNLAIQEVDEQIKTASETNYAARLFVQGSIVALQAIVAFDGPKLPSEIALRVPDLQLKAPDHMPGMTITLQAPDSLPPIHLVSTPQKGVA